MNHKFLMLLIKDQIHEVKGFSGRWVVFYVVLFLISLWAVANYG